MGHAPYAESDATTAAEVRQQPGASASGRLSFESRRQLTDSSGQLMLKNLTIAELEEWCLADGRTDRQRLERLSSHMVVDWQKFYPLSVLSQGSGHREHGSCGNGCIMTNFGLAA